MRRSARSGAVSGGEQALTSTIPGQHAGTSEIWRRGRPASTPRLAIGRCICPRCHMVAPRRDAWRSLCRVGGCIAQICRAHRAAPVWLRSARNPLSETPRLPGGAITPLRDALAMSNGSARRHVTGPRCGRFHRGQGSDGCRWLPASGHPARGGLKVRVRYAPAFHRHPTHRASVGRPGNGGRRSGRRA